MECPLRKFAAGRGDTPVLEARTSGFGHLRPLVRALGRTFERRLRPDTGRSCADHVGRVVLRFVRRRATRRCDAVAHSPVLVALTGFAGRVVTQAMAVGTAAFDLCAKLRYARFRGGPSFRGPALEPGMLYHRIRELFRNEAPRPARFPSRPKQQQTSLPDRPDWPFDPPGRPVCHVTVIVCDPRFSRVCLSTGCEYSRTEFPLLSEHYAVCGVVRAGCRWTPEPPHDCFRKAGCKGEVDSRVASGQMCQFAPGPCQAPFTDGLRFLHRELARLRRTERDREMLKSQDGPRRLCRLQEIAFWSGARRCVSARGPPGGGWSASISL